MSTILRFISTNVINIGWGHPSIVSRLFGLVMFCSVILLLCLCSCYCFDAIYIFDQWNILHLFCFCQTLIQVFRMGVEFVSPATRIRRMTKTGHQNLWDYNSWNLHKDSGNKLKIRRHLNIFPWTIVTRSIYVGENIEYQ